MKHTANDSFERPVIWTVSVSRLSGMLRDIIPEFDQRAEIVPIQLGFDDAVEVLREKLHNERCDVIISAGSNGHYLKSRVSVPVVLITPSGFDYLQAITHAHQSTEKIGIIHYHTVPDELTQFLQCYQLPIEQRHYVTHEDARNAINAFQAAGIEAVVGAGLISELAEGAGMQGILVYSSNTIRATFEHAIELAKIQRNASLFLRNSRVSPNKTIGLAQLRGNSQAMQLLRQKIQLVAKASTSVFIHGETGSGKELVARAIHQSSRRSNGSFIALNCGAISENLLEAELFGYEEGAFTGARRGGHAGVFEAANRGTLFLDEISEMPIHLQSRLLRVLEEKEVTRVGATRPIAVDVRILCASHTDILERCKLGSFRFDLYYRLVVLQIDVPPLRHRLDDIHDLSLWYLKLALADLGISPQATLSDQLLSCTDSLKKWDWPGNVRELRNLMERVALQMSAEPLQALTPTLMHSIYPQLKQTQTTRIAQNSNETIASLMERFKGNRDAIAQHLGISRTTLWRRIKALDPRDN